MKRQIFVACLALLCAGAILGGLASAASAGGTTAFTCKEGVVTGTRYSDAHCKIANSEGKFGRTEVAPGTETTFTGSNGLTASETTAATPLLIASTAGGEALEVECTGVAAAGTMAGKETEGQMSTTGTATIPGSACLVKKPSAGGCAVSGGTVESKSLTLATVGLTSSISFSPAAGSTLLSFKLSGCTNAALNAEYALTGSWKMSEEGVTLSSTHSGTTGEAGLKLNGAAAGLSTTITLRGRKAGEGGAETPLMFVQFATGTRAYTCQQKEGSGQSFSDAHCRIATEAGKFHHFDFVGTTELGLSNAKTGSETTVTLPIIVKSTIHAKPFQVTCLKVGGSGTGSNGTVGGEPFWSASVTLTFSECMVVKPEAEGCKLKGSGFTFESTKTTTAGQGDGVRFEGPGGKMGTITVEGCTEAAENGAYSVTGGWRTIPNGATLNSTHAENTAQAVLKLGGSNLGLEGSITLSGREKGGVEAESPISFTTR